MTASNSAQIDHFGKGFAPFQLLASAVEQLAWSHHRNAEAATEVAKLTSESMRAVWQKQWLFSSELVTGAQTGFQDLWSFDVPDEAVAKRTAIARASVEKAVTGAREINDLFLKSGGQVADLLAKRITEGLKELQAFPSNA